MWTVLVATAIVVVATAILLPMTRRGMRWYFGPLIAMLAGDDPRCRVDEEPRRTIVLRLETDEGETFFRIRQTPVHLVVQWTNESPATGTHARRWTFFKFGSQRAMKDRIYDDLLIAHRSMMRS